VQELPIAGWSSTATGQVLYDNPAKTLTPAQTAT
jgi:hypothetical protein